MESPPQSLIVPYFFKRLTLKFTFSEVNDHFMSMAFRVYCSLNFQNACNPKVEPSGLNDRILGCGFTIFRGYVGAITQLVKLIDGPSSKPTMVTLSPQENRRRRIAISNSWCCSYIYIYIYYTVYTHIYDSWILMVVGS